jgi:hypothetical protein
MIIETATPTPGPGLYHVETFPIGSCVCDVRGFNCLSFPEKPGAKFTTLEEATAICEKWNSA